MSEIGKYIYGIVNSNTAFRLFSAKDFSQGEIGQTNGVYAVSYQDISAVVSNSKIVDYTLMPKHALGGLLVNHQKVIEKIMNLGYTIVPVRLGTLVDNDFEAKDALNKGYNLLKDIMEKIENKIEIDLAVTWNDFSSVLKEVGQEQEIKELKEKLLANSKSVTVGEQMKIGIMVKKVLETKRESCAEEIKNILKTVSQDFKVHGLMDDKMLLNCAFLINRDKQKEFDEIIEELNTKFAEKINFRCVGPLPPYSFYTLEIKKMRFEEVDWARKKLGLDEIVTKEEINKARKAKALLTHPDRNPNIPDIESKFDEVTKAYKTLLDYCQNDNCSFKEEDFEKNSLVVKVK